MAYTLSCKDTGVDCPYVARGETEEEMLQDGIKHVKEVHGYTDEQLNPSFLEEVKKFVKSSKKDLEKNELDSMVSIYVQAQGMDENHKTAVKAQIKSYLDRFNELATSADRVLDYAQLSKKAPKMDELEGGGDSLGRPNHGDRRCV